MSRTVVLVDAVRTPFGKAGGMYAGTRADDLMVRAIRGLLERNSTIDPASIEDVAIAAATQTGDQGMNIGRSASFVGRAYLTQFLVTQLIVGAQVR
jgi:acetyl-CoA acyltransferase